MLKRHTAVAGLNAETLRRARLAAARENPRWTEIEEADVIRRKPFLVHAPTDVLVLPDCGATWVSGGAGAPEDTPSRARR
jgi:hypothetical protein